MGGCRLSTLLLVICRDAFAAEQQGLEAQRAAFAAKQAAVERERSELQAESERLAKLQQRLDNQAAALEQGQAVARPGPGLQAQLASLQDQVSLSSARGLQMGPQFHAPAQSAEVQYNPPLTRQSCYLVPSDLLSSALLLGYQTMAGITQMSTERCSQLRFTHANHTARL